MKTLLLFAKSACGLKSRFVAVLALAVVLISPPRQFGRNGIILKFRL